MPDSMNKFRTAWTLDCLYHGANRSDAARTAKIEEAAMLVIQDLTLFWTGLAIPDQRRLATFRELLVQHDDAHGVVLLSFWRARVIEGWHAGVMAS